jgi:hypothetical protein
MFQQLFQEPKDTAIIYRSMQLQHRRQKTTTEARKMKHHTSIQPLHSKTKSPNPRMIKTMEITEIMETTVTVGTMDEEMAMATEATTTTMGMAIDKTIIMEETMVTMAIMEKTIVTDHQLLSAMDVPILDI